MLYFKGLSELFNIYKHGAYIGGHIIFEHYGWCRCRPTLGTYPGVDPGGGAWGRTPPPLHCNNTVRTISKMGQHSSYSIMGANYKYLRNMYDMSESKVHGKWKWV